VAAVLTRLRAELRSRWRAWLAIAFLIGFAGGVVLTTAAGARRTASAYPRFLRRAHAASMLVSPNNTGFPGYYAALAHDTGAVVTPVIGFGTAPAHDPAQPLLVTASPDPKWGTVVERPKITTGRMFRPASGDEVVADIAAARALHLHPGSRLTVIVASRNEELPSPAHDKAVTVDVVGIGVTRDSVVTVNALAAAPSLIAGPAFAREFGPGDYAFDGAYATLAPGASKSAFMARAQTVAQRFPQTGGGVFVADETQQAGQVEHAIRPQAVALGLFAALTALTALFALGQVLARQLHLTSTDNDVLRSLGMSRTQLFALGMAQVGAAAVVGAFIAVVVAIVASPTMPIGPARLAEPHPGVALDWVVLGGGFLLLVALLVASAAWPAWRAATPYGDPRRAPDGGTRRPSRLTRQATSAGAPPSVAIGVGYAVDPGRGRAAVPVRSAIAVTALAITALAAAITFGTNLSGLVQTPRLYGQSWDITADAQFGALPSGQIVALLRKDPGVQAWTFGVHDDITVDGQDVPTIGLSPPAGPVIAPTVVTGRAAESAHEIMLGTKTLDHLHRRVGQTVSVQFQVMCCTSTGAHSPPAREMRIVGRSVFPFFGEGSFTPTGLGVGAQVTNPPVVANDPNRVANFVLVRVAAGPEHDAQVARVVHDLGRTTICGSANQCAVSTASRPADILNYTRVKSTPVALAVVLALLAIGVVTNLLVSSIRRRRRGLAILKTLGFRRRQVSFAVAWQATALVAIALVIGLPIGTALGRWVWTTFATNLGLPGNPRTPVHAFLIAIPVALVIGNAIALGPGILAGRLRPATALRTE
jgi:ABC-type antimicrobial peptide transport system permease subunit